MTTDIRFVIGLAILPVLILLYYTYQQDKLQREPVKEVVKGFFYGWLSVLCSFFISVPARTLAASSMLSPSAWASRRSRTSSISSPPVPIG